MDLLLIIVLTLLNGVFAMSEMAIAASKRIRLVALAEVGDKGAVKALALMDSPTQFLSTVQIGITSIGMLNGIVGEAAFSAGLAQWLGQLGVASKPADIAATGIVVVTITFTTIIFGELVPKRIGQLYPELVARHIAKPMGMLAVAASPFVRLLSACTAAILKLLRVNVNAAQEVTEDEIQASLKEGVEAGVIEATEHELVRNVFHLDERPLTSLMVPRADTRWFDASKTVAQALAVVRAEASNAQEGQIHSWYPVCRGGLHDVVGAVSMQQLALASDESLTLESIAQPATFAPETLTGMELLQQFRERVPKIVLVVDEYGEFQGLLTPHDVLEAITGELRNDSGDDAWATAQADGSWILDGGMPIAEFKRRLGIAQDLPDEDKARYSSVAGFVMLLAGHLPKLGEVVAWANWRFAVEAVEGRRLVSLRVRKSG